MIGREKRVLLRHYLEQGMNKAGIARDLGVSRRTVYHWIETGQLDRELDEERVGYGPRCLMPSKLDPYKPLIDTRLKEYPKLTAVRLFKEVRAAGYPGSYNQVKRYVRKVRPRPPEEPVVRFETAPGRQGQVDFAHFRLPWGKRYALIVVLGYSRLLWVQFYTRQTMKALMHGLESSFSYFGGVPRELLFDPMKAVVIEDGRYDDGALVENPEFMRYAYHWNFRIRACRPYRAQTKGKVERPIRYLRESFFYGRTFTSDDDLNAQALHWLETEANVRSHATLKERPLDRFERERLLLEPLATRPYHPLVLPPDRSSPGTTSLPAIHVERRPQHGATTMKRTYEVRDRADKRAIREFLKREGQFLLPMLELVEQTEVAIDEVIQVMGRATIEAVLEMSAEGVAGVKQAGRSRAEDDTVWYGRQGGVVYLSDRKVRVERPRLRRRGVGEGGEVEVPAYAAMRRPGAVADRMLEVLMAGVSTRKYGRVIGEMADTVGVSKSAVSRETVEASERVLKELMERRLDAWDLLVIYLDGIQMGSHHVLAAVGVDSDGKKHVLGVREGASENAEVTSALLEDLVERGLDPGRRRLFVIDGSKALRKAIEKVFGQRHPIQRCRNHKLRNVLGHLPKDQHPQVKAAFRAAMKLDAKQGEQKLEQLARWLERDHPSASASLREGLSEMFTINRLGLPPRLRKCLGSTNLIDSTHSGVRQKTRRVTHWKNGAMALRWAAASFVETEKSYRRIIGYDQLWMLRAHLDDHEPVAEMRKAG